MSSEAAWNTLPLKSAGITLIDCDHRTPSAVEAGYPYIAIPQLKDGHISLNGVRRISESDYADWTKKLTPQANDVIVVRRCNSGQSAHVPANLKCAIGQNLVVLRADGTKVLPEYLRWLVRGDEWWAEVGKYINVGAVFDSLRCRDIPNFAMPIPPLNEQLGISKLMAALDDRITLLRETNATLEAIAEALFKSWFVDFDPVRAKMEGRAPEGMDEATAALFPDGLEESESELGAVPRGWQVSKFEDFINRMSVGKKFDKKTASEIGTTPILDQGKSGIIGFHNESPGIHASLENPVIVFANHTCYMRLISFDFSVIQNVLPFTGKNVDTVWAFYATKGRVKFSEYKGHWPDFSIEKTVVPAASLTFAFRKIIEPLMRSVRCNELQAQTLSTLRDTLLPRLISGQLRLPTDMPSSQNPSYQSEPP